MLKMAAQTSCQKKSSTVSFSVIISVLSVLFYCAGFVRVELLLNEQQKKIIQLEDVVEELKTTANDEQANLSKNTINEFQPKPNRNRRHADSPGLPGPPGPPGARGEKGSRGRRGDRGKKGARGVMGHPGKSGKQGIMGPMGMKGETGIKGEKGSIGPQGMPGAKGEPGESISAPTAVISPVKLTVNEKQSASFRCSASGNPEPSIAWSKADNSSDIIQSGAELSLDNVTGKDTGLYQCSAVNILGQAQSLARLVVNVHPRVSLHPGPHYAIEGSDVTFPTCDVTGYPPPVVTWRKLSGKLPQERVRYNNGTLQMSNVRKSDSDTYFCSAVNVLGTDERRALLVVASHPRFSVKPPSRVVVTEGDTLTLNCSATGDPRPIVSWKRYEAQLPVGRSLQANGVLVLRNMRSADTGNYICVATSAGLFGAEAVTYVNVLERRGLYSHRPAHSCKDVQATSDGKYWINPEKNGNPLKVYCDMTTDGGGWLLVSDVVTDSSSPPQLSIETSYRGISKSQMFLQKSAMNQLKTHLAFSQIRFYCKKKRTFHVTTAKNSAGGAVVQYFSGQSDVMPTACGSYVRMNDDNSLLSGACSRWGYNGRYNVGKWGHLRDQNRLYDHPAFVVASYHWLIEPGGSRWECDDFGVGVTPGDFWKVFVR